MGSSNSVMGRPHFPGVISRRIGRFLAIELDHAQ